MLKPPGRRDRISLHVLAALLAVLLLAISGFGPGREVGLAQDAPRDTALWINVPFFPQTTDGCGSASIAMVVSYWNHKTEPAVSHEVDPLKIQARLFSPAAHGIYASRMERYLTSLGYRVFSFSGRWNDLARQIALGRPLIVAFKASGPHGPLHYSVVVGIDSRRGTLFLNDPARRKMLRISRAGFESEWRATHNWMLLAVPKTQP